MRVCIFSVFWVIVYLIIHELIVLTLQRMSWHEIRMCATVLRFAVHYPQPLMPFSIPVQPITKGHICVNVVQTRVVRARLIRFLSVTAVACPQL